MLKEESSGEGFRRTEDSEGEEMQRSRAALHGDLIETSPVSVEAAIDAGATTGRVIEACPLCETLMDVTDQPPLSQVRCPSCGQRLRAHRQFNNYRLLELLGEGGMGSVYKATDLNLNREVALKILKKKCSANAEERAKLEEEARIIASINHPHVVKVFSFGEDQGQFYLAMELAEKGSLDDLMSVQQRLSEAQVLRVGIQIAEGLDAALEHNLIHRDIKPGNILFADPQTAKLVDFGLAVGMDEVAHARGEIWGTPYYIAPEKLDNQPEDFRSDIYSLGGTLFHALAGRPPYEADTASTLALKQLMSQPVSLQAFAPDVSSETAYVINRMLAKNPAERYASYPELVEHLSYARSKLLERSKHPSKAKERVVIETQATKNVAGLLSLGLLSMFIAAGIMIYVFRGEIFGGLFKNAASASYSGAQVKEGFRSAVQLLARRQPQKALNEFERLEPLSGNQQPLKNWIRMNGALAALVAGDPKEAAIRFDALANEEPYSVAEKEKDLANFFVEASKQLAKPDKPIPASITRLYSNENFETFGLLCFALHDWTIGDVKNASEIFHAFLSAKLPAPESWINELKPMAVDYAADCAADWDRVAEIEKDLLSVTDAESARALAKKVRRAQDALKIGGKAPTRLKSIEAELVAKGAHP
jgi:eukaryotic-like serine/threonine-protein kinase